MSILNATNLSKYYGGDHIFSDISVEVPHSARIALVGPNGAGKTTLIKCFIGDELPSDGTIHTAKGARLAHLPQRPELVGDHGIWEEQLRAFTHLRQMERDLADLAEQMIDDESAIDRYSALQAQFEQAGGYDYETRIQMVLSGVGFSEADYETPLSQLSGGQKTRTLLARLLLQSPDLLILDEPTNHLDIYAVEWLESFLKSYDGAVLAISHDRRFIDNYANTVWEMEFGTIEVYRGNYTHYMQQRDERRERRLKAYEKQQEFIAKEMDYIRKHMGSRWTAQAKGRLKKLQTMQKRGKIIDHAPRDRKTMNISIAADARSGDKVITTRNLTVGYDQALFTAPDLTLWRGETAAIIGANGAGKSTLMKTLIGELDPLAGERKLGASVQIGYFAQAHEGLDPDQTVLDTIMQAGNMGVADARQYLGAYLFSGEDVFRPIRTLSGGERGRVALAQLALTGANLLLLDEPTNHLDIDAQEILQAVVEGFNGTVLLISHDRHLIDALATQIWAVQRDGTMDVFEGSYGDYMTHKRTQQEQRAQKTQTTPANGRKKAAQVKTKVRGMNPYELRQRVADLEGTITDLEADLDRLTDQIEQASAAGDAGRVQELGEAYTAAEHQLEQALDEWSELAEHVE
jgi:ATP-binding cassette, subfamily F, member 3